MSSSTVEAVVLRRWDSGESDRRISLLTKERGKVFAIARGARKSKSKLAAATEPLSLSTFELAHGKLNEYVTQVQTKSSFSKIRANLLHLSSALAFVESVDSVIPVGELQGEIFELLMRTLNSFEATNHPLATLCWADIKLMEMSGFSPEFRVSAVSGKPLSGDKRILCPAHGGAVLIGEFQDHERAFLISKKTSIALFSIQDLDNPPSFLKDANDVARAIYPFWLEISSHALPARKSLLDSFAK